MRELNGDYLNTSLTANTNWYNGSNNAQTGVFDYTKRLKAAAQAQIGDAKWHLGGIKDENNDLIPSTWTGKVALIYPSDYGYATAGGEVTNRSSCINTLSLYENITGETWKNSASGHL